MKLSTRNQLAGQVTDVKLGGVMAEVTVEIGGGQTIVAAITRGSAEHLELASGDSVVRAIAKGKDPRGMPAKEVSSQELLTVSPDDDLSDALMLMAQHQVRRLAVTAADDRLVGVISQADIALQGKDKETGQVVGGISRQPQGPRTL